METEITNDKRAPTVGGNTSGDGINPTMKSWFLKGKLAYLRGMTEDDLPALVGWLDDRRVTRFLSRGMYPATQATARAEHQTMQQSPNDVEFAVVDSSSGSCIGITGLHAIEWTARHGEFRILIGEPSAWGRGIGTEACQLLCCYGFEVLNLNKIYLGASVENHGAIRSYEKSGFRSEGTLRQEVYRNSTYYDVTRMSMLRQEYEAAWPTWSIAEQISDMFPRE